MLSASKVDDGDMTTDEIKYLMERLQRKRSLLNKAIGIESKAQRKNLMWRINQGRGHKTDRIKINARAVHEWRTNGLSIQRLNRELQKRRIDNEVSTV